MKYTVEMWLFDLAGRPWGPFWVGHEAVDLVQEREGAATLATDDVIAAVALWLKNRPIHHLNIQAESQ